MNHPMLPALAAAAVVVCSPVFAQSVDGEIDNIVVSASRAPMPTVAVGSATSVITSEQIELRQARYVTDLLRSVPGFAVSQVGTTGSQTQVRVRGAEANHVLVLIDGVRANDPASGDEFRWELLSTSNIERIEIVRGPQSSLWGSDAVAAVVHVITKSGAAGGGFEAYGEGGSNSTLNGGLAGGTGGENWSLGFGVERLASDGTNISREGSEDDDSDMTTASASLSLDASDDLRFNLGLRAVDAYSQFDPVDFFVTGLPTDGDVATDAKRYYWNAGAALSTLDGVIVHRLGARYLDTENRNLTDGAEASSTASDRRTFLYQADFRIGDNLLSAAYEHESTNFRQRGEAVFGDPNQDQEISVDSMIVDFQGRSLERLTWLASLRYDDNSDFDSATSGRLSFAWEASSTTVLRANAGTGRKAPTFIERFGFFPGQFIGNPELKPEKSTSYDIGIDLRVADGALDLGLSVYHQDLEDEINGFVFDPDTFLFTADNIDGGSTRRGVEASADWRASEQWRFGLSYTYTDATEDAADGVAVRELRRPRHVGSASTDYRFLDGRATVTLVADYGGSSTDIFFPPFPQSSETVRLDSFWLVDLTAAFDVTESANVFLRTSNLLDEAYEQVYGYRAPGRAVYGGVRVNFGGASR